MPCFHRPLPPSVWEDRLPLGMRNCLQSDPARCFCQISGCWPGVNTWKYMQIWASWGLAKAWGGAAGQGDGCRWGASAAYRDLHHPEWSVSRAQTCRSAHTGQWGLNKHTLCWFGSPYWLWQAVAVIIFREFLIEGGLWSHILIAILRNQFKQEILGNVLLPDINAVTVNVLLTQRCRLLVDQSSKSIRHIEIFATVISFHNALLPT